MRAIVLEGFGGPDAFVYKDIPKPEPLPGHVVIQIEAFGINHAEMHMRRGEWAENAGVIGLECVGVVDACPGGEFPIGAKVAAMMGGMGRTINGSYAEFVLVPTHVVTLIDADLPCGPSSPPCPRATRPPRPASSVTLMSPKARPC
jgi:NADPH:quinone reductase